MQSLNSEVLESIENAGYVDYNTFNFNNAQTQFSYSRDGYFVVLKCQKPLTLDSPSSYEIFYNNQSIFRSETMALKTILDTSVLDSIKNFDRTRKLLEPLNFRFVNNCFKLKRKVMDSIVTYIYDDSFYALFKNKKYILDLNNFDMNEFERFLVEKEIKEKGAKKYLRRVF